MTTALVIGLLATPSSGAAPIQPAADKAAPVSSGELDGASPDSCSARKALRFYRAAYLGWRSKMGAAESRAGQADPEGTRPGKDRPRQYEPGACPRYLAHLWQRKAHAARVAYEKWQRTIGRHVNRLDRGLAGSPMAGTGAILDRYGRRFHVSPYFMAAAAATESSLGAAACSNNRFNVWGLSSCGSGWYVPPFRSWDEAIAFYARFLSSRWPGHSTPYSFRGYAACSDCWGRKVSYWMHSLFGVSSSTRYP